MRLNALLCFVAALLIAVNAYPFATNVSDVADEGEPDGPIITEAQLMHWLATTDAKLTFIGPRPTFNPLSPRSAQTTVVTYCSKRAGRACGGECTVYNGGAACVDTPHTECMMATKDVGYCDLRGCNGNCNDLSACGTRLCKGFCYTPGTRSIVVSPL